MPEPHPAASIGDRFRAVAQRHAGRIAIVERDVQATYGEVDAGATALAAVITAAGRGRSGAVCLLFERKRAAIEAMLAALRSGYAYVPLDAGDPEARLRFVVGDAAPIAIVTEHALRDRAAAIAPAGCAVIDVDDPQRAPADGPPPPVDPDAMALIYYTSGSTGTPKGVIQTHRNLLHFTDTYIAALRLAPRDRMSLLYTLGVAAANNNVIRGLLAGATLCAYDLRGDGIDRLADWLDRERITLLHTVPTVFREMARRLAPQRVLPHLRVVHLGGEAVYAGDVELYRRHTLGACVLVNQLASSEAGIVAQCVLDHRGPAVADAIVPVGRALGGARVEIRRADGSLCDIDEVGELVACGPHLCPGYWRRPDLTADAFSPDRGQPGWRCFRTGDLARVDAAGNLHFLGRAGGRVKIRGHTVDLAEIDAALAGCRSVALAAAVAAAGEGQAEATRLIAYVEAPPGATRDPQALRRELAARLPRHMLPARIVYVDALPRTAGGKVDRSALPTTVPPPAAPERAIVPPHDNVEAEVARTFAQLLQLEQVGRDDDFFLLGGDSLLGVELQASLREAFGVHVAHLHADATVAGIAATIRAARAQSAGRMQPMPVLVPLWRHGDQPPLFLVHGRHGQAFVSPQFMQLLGDDQPVWAFQARGLDGLAQPHATVEAMAAEYLEALRGVRPRGPYFLGALCAGAFVTAVMARALRAAGEHVLPLLLLDPPNSVLEPGYAQLTETRFVEKMRARKALGRTSGPLDDPAHVEALITTALAFERAIAHHQPLSYDGPVYVLSSRQRMHDPVALRRVFTGRFKRYEVGATHTQALDPRNPVFVDALTRCVGLIREAARALPRGGTDVALGAPTRPEAA